jgi:hypothetical protein
MGTGIKTNKVELFLDSGAFSAFTQNIEIDIQEYIEFIKEHKDSLEVYANLDSIGDAERTWKNQKIMERAGLNPLPCFHYGDDIKWLRRYMKDYDYIALGGMVPISNNPLAKWLDVVFQDYICGEDGYPMVKTHGFGLTSLKLMMRYPWYSVDSTSWVMTGRMGSIYVPRWYRGQWVYDQDSYKITVSSRSPSTKEAGQHILTMSPKYKQIILNYITEKGYRLGHSVFHEEDESYELKENQKWNGKAKGGKRCVETIEEVGISNDYKLRDEMNIIYFLDLEKSFPEYPVKFNVRKKKGLGIV